MVDVGVGKHNGVDAARLQGKTAISLASLSTTSLKESTIEQDGLATDFQNVHGTGDLLGGAVKG